MKPATTDKAVWGGAAESREIKWVEVVSEALELAAGDLALSSYCTAVKE